MELNAYLQSVWFLCVQRAKDRGSERPEIPSPEELLATQEHEAVAGTPEAVRVAVVGTEPPLAVVALNAPDAEAAVRVSDRLHRNDEPLTFRLVLVLQTQSGTDFV